MKQIKFISSLFFLVVFISCSENSSSLVNPENNLDKKGISQVVGGGDALTVSCVAYDQNLPAAVASYVVTMEDIWTRGGGSSPMTWSVYSTYVDDWDWKARVYINETPPTYVYPKGNPIYEGDFGFTTGSINTTFEASAGDVIYLWVWAYTIESPLYEVSNNMLQKLGIQGTGTLHLD